MDANKTAGEETGMAITQECCVQSWTSPGSSTPQDTNCTATCPLSRKTIQVRRTRHAGHCWRSRDELIRDVLLWISTHGRAKAGRPARTYIQQLCEDTGCCPEDLPRAINDREEWRERVRDIRATSTIWWWWWYLSMIPQAKCILTSPTACMTDVFFVDITPCTLIWCIKSAELTQVTCTL